MKDTEKKGVAVYIAFVGWVVASFGMIMSLVDWFLGGPLTTEGWWWVAVGGFLLLNLGVLMAKVMGE